MKRQNCARTGREAEQDGWKQRAKVFLRRLKRLSCRCNRRAPPIKRQITQEIILVEVLRISYELVTNSNHRGCQGGKQTCRRLSLGEHVVLASRASKAAWRPLPIGLRAANENSEKMLIRKGRSLKNPLTAMNRLVLVNRGTITVSQDNNVFEQHL